MFSVHHFSDYFAAVSARIIAIRMQLGFFLGAQSSRVIGKQFVILVEIVVFVVVEKGFRHV